ncbi:MAG: antirestriction protein ArdA, partial [Eubacterium sp.]
MIELKGYVTNLGKYNEGELVGEWVTFPIDEDEKEEIFERINIGGEYEEFFITDWDCEITEVIKDLGEYESITYINELAEALENVHDERLLYAALELGGYSKILDIIENIDSYTLLE